MVSLALFIYKNSKDHEFIKEIGKNINADVLRIKQQYHELSSWKKYVIIGIVIYMLVKLCMVFSLNTYMPTYDEDAVTGRDLKTKIFTEHKSLVLDKTNPEFF